jgi:hypothetical protein
VAYNFQTGNNKIKLLMEYESVTQKVLFGNGVLPTLTFGRKYVDYEDRWWIEMSQNCVQ